MKKLTQIFSEPSETMYDKTLGQIQLHNINLIGCFSKNTLDSSPICSIYTPSCLLNKEKNTKNNIP
jgi:hypothetical protein